MKLMLPPRPSFNFQTRLLRTRSTEATPHKTKPTPNTPWQNVAPALHRPSVPSKSPCAFWGPPTTSTTVALYIHHSPVKTPIISTRSSSPNPKSKASRNGIHESSDESDDGGLEIGICFVDGVIGQMHHDF